MEFQCKELFYLSPQQLWIIYTTIKELLNDVIAAVNHLNPNQVSVIVMDQSLFAIAKQIQ